MSDGAVGTAFANIDVHVVDHPLVAARVTALRDEATSRGAFRAALAEMATLLTYEATRDAAVDRIEVRTPLTEATGIKLANPPLLVPVLRAGLGMAEAAQRLLPESQMGFVGLARDEDTHEPHAYMESLPEKLDEIPVLILDPMLATGGSLIHTLRLVIDRGARSITVVSVIAAPEGLMRVDEFGVKLKVITAVVDSHLDENAFIVPGLGDAGDRQFGRVEN